MTYLVSYRQEDGELECVEVSAYSESQAKFLAPCQDDEVLDIELTVVK